MAGTVTSEEWMRLQRYLNSENDGAKRTAVSSKTSFLEWLKFKGLNYLVEKLLDILWEEIKRRLGL